MRRREFISLFGGAAAAWPLAARAQRAERMRRIGVLVGSAESDPKSVPRVTAFERGLAELGWASGRKVLIDYRWAAGRLCSYASVGTGIGRAPARCASREQHPCRGGARP